MTASSSQRQSLNLRLMASISLRAQHRQKRFTSPWKKYCCSVCREDFIQHSHQLMLPIKSAIFHHCYPAMLSFTFQWLKHKKTKKKALYLLKYIKELLKLLRFVFPNICIMTRTTCTANDNSKLTKLRRQVAQGCHSSKGFCNVTFTQTGRNL